MSDDKSVRADAAASPSTAPLNIDPREWWRLPYANLASDICIHLSLAFGPHGPDEHASSRMVLTRDILEKTLDAAASRAHPENEQPPLTVVQFDNALKNWDIDADVAIPDGFRRWLLLRYTEALASRAPSPQGEDTFTASTMTPMERARFAIRAGAPNRDLLSALVGEIDRLVRQLETAPSPQDAGVPPRVLRELCLDGRIPR